MASRDNRMPHLGVLAAGQELAEYAEVSRERARQLTLKDWWTIDPVDFVGGRFVYPYPDAIKLLTEHHYPKRLYGDPDEKPRRRKKADRAQAKAVTPRVNRGVLAGVGEIARAARVPTSRAARMTTEDWWTVGAIDHLAGGTIYPYPAVVTLLTSHGYPRTYKTIGEKLEAKPANRRRA